MVMIVMALLAMGAMMVCMRVMVVEG